MSKYLDETGLARVWSNIKTYLSNNYQPKGSYAAASHTHSYLPLSGGTMSNTTKVTNLNADLLDGYNASDFATSGHTHSNYVDGTAGTTSIKKIWCGSQASYNAISSKSADTLYFIV